MELHLLAPYTLCNFLIAFELLRDVENLAVRNCLNPSFKKCPTVCQTRVFSLPENSLREQLLSSLQDYVEAVFKLLV